MPVLDRVMRLYQIAEGAVPIPLRVDGTDADLNFRVMQKSEIPTILRNNFVIRLGIYRKTSLVTRATTLTGVLPAGTILNIGVENVQVARDERFQQGTIPMPKTLGWASQSRAPIYWQNGIFTGETETADLDRVDDTLHLLNAAGGMDAYGWLATGTGAAHPLSARPVQPPHSYAGQAVQFRLQRRLFNSELPRDPWLFPVSFAPFGILPSAAFGQFAEYNMLIEQPIAQGLVYLSEPLNTAPVDGQLVQVVTTPDPEASGAGTEIWCELVSENISESIDASQNIAAVQEASVIVRGDAVRSTFDLLVDDRGRTWDIRGIDRIDKQYSNIQLQRSLGT